MGIRQFSSSPIFPSRTVRPSTAHSCGSRRARVPNPAVPRPSEQAGFRSFGFVPMNSTMTVGSMAAEPSLFPLTTGSLPPKTQSTTQPPRHGPGGAVVQDILLAATAGLRALAVMGRRSQAFSSDMEVPGQCAPVWSPAGRRPHGVT